MYKQRLWRICAAFNGLMAVAMGAVSAHIITDSYAVTLAERASLYQLVHAVLLLWLAEKPGRAMAAARWLVLAGFIMFCGALYLKALAIFPAATAVAPLGGSAFMLGWIFIMFGRI